MQNWDRSEYDRQRYLARKGELLELLGSECSQCGSTDRIEFDHIDPTTKSFDILEQWNRPIEELVQEVRKCQPLCYSCHREKSLAQLSVEHGGGASGKRNCKCDLCRAKKNEYMREWKRRKRLQSVA